MIHQGMLKFMGETSRSNRIFAQHQSISPKYIFIAMVVLTDVPKLFDIPVSKRWEIHTSPFGWTYCLSSNKQSMKRKKKKNSKFTKENSHRSTLKKLSKLILSVLSPIDIMYLLICDNDQNTSLLQYVSPKSIISLQLLKKKTRQN